MSRSARERTQAQDDAKKIEDNTDEPIRSKPSGMVADFYRPKPVFDRRIHIMGVGNVGSFIAHALRGIPNPPPVTLIFSKRNKLKEWEKSPQRLTLVTDGDSEVHEGYEAEIAIPRIRYHGKEVGLNAASAVPVKGASDASNTSKEALVGESDEPIRSLILCSKAPHVLQGLSSIKHRLDKDSVILFLQNGMGIAEEVTREIFPDPDTRPYYMLGINSHGLNNASTAAFTTTHAGFGTILLGTLPHERDRKSHIPYEPTSKLNASKNSDSIPSSQSVQPDQVKSDDFTPESNKPRWTPNERYLLRTLLRAPILAAASFSPPDLLQLQLEKLAVNCIVNPLTVLFDARNGALLYNFALTRTMRLLLAEISLVIRSLPELQYIPNVQTRFDPGRLETIVVGVANKTKDNISSMLADARLGKQTEIDYINGWIVQKGEELGIRCGMNYMIMQMVKAKVAMINREIGEGVPLVGVEEKGSEGDLKVKEGMAAEKEESDL